MHDVVEESATSTRKEITHGNSVLLHNIGVLQQSIMPHGVDYKSLRPHARRTTKRSRSHPSVCPSASAQRDEHGEYRFYFTPEQGEPHVFVKFVDQLACEYGIKVRASL